MAALVAKLVDDAVDTDQALVMPMLLHEVAGTALEAMPMLAEALDEESWLKETAVPLVELWETDVELPTASVTLSQITAEPATPATPRLPETL